MLINYYKTIFILIIFFYSNFSFSCIPPKISGENEIYEYAKKYKNVKNFDCNTNTLKIMQEIVQITTKAVNYSSERSKLVKECGEKCEDKIINLTKRIKDDQKILLKLAEKYKSIGLDKLAYILTIDLIYRGIEFSCDRKNRALLYREHFVSTMKKMGNSTPEFKKRFRSIYKKVYSMTLNDIDSRLFKIQCSWKTLNIRYIELQTEHNNINKK